MRRILAVAISASGLIPAALAAQVPGVLSQNNVLDYAVTTPGVRGTIDSYLCPNTNGNINSSCGMSGSADIISTSSPNGSQHVYSLLTLNGMIPQITTQSGTYAHGIDANAFTRIRDIVTFTGPTPVTLRFAYALAGNREYTDPESNHGVYYAGGARVQFGSSLTGPPTVASVLYSDWAGGTGVRSNSTSQAGFVDVAVNNSASVYFYMALAAEADMSWAPGTPLYGTALADYSNAWTVQALDAQGNDMTRASGLEFAYGEYASPVSTPEPATLLLLLPGVAAIVVIRRRHSA